MSALSAIMYREGKIRATNLTFIFWDLFYPLGYLLVFGVGMTEAMGMKPYLERARHLRAGQPPVARRARVYPDGLSQREAEVLRLLATGKANQQIADELVISLNTVQRHVSNILAKTGLANRTEAALYAHRNGLA